MTGTSTCAIDDLREIFEVSAADGYLPKMELSGGAVLDILYGNGHDHGPGSNGNGNGNGSNGNGSNGNGHAPAHGRP